MDVPSSPPILPTMVSMETASSFFDYFKSLSRDRRNAVFPYVKDKLPSLIKSSYDYFLVFCYLDEKQQGQVFSSSKSVIPLIENFSNFYDIFNALAPERRFRLINYFTGKGKTHLLTNDLSNIYSIILRFEYKERFAVLSMLNREGGVSSLFKDTSSVLFFLKSFDVDSRFEVFKALLVRSEVARLFDGVRSFQDLFNCFGTNIHFSLHDGLQLELIINTEYKFVEFFICLRANDHTEFIHMVNLPSIITNIDKLEFIFDKLNTKQRALLFPYVKEHLCSLINDGIDFIRATRCLTPNQVTLLKASFFSSDVVLSPVRPRLC